MASQAPLQIAGVNIFDQPCDSNSGQPQLETAIETLQPLPHFVLDNLPSINFDASVNCAMDSVDQLSCEQYTDLEDSPAKVLIDTRGMSCIAFSKVLSAYLAVKAAHPSHEACIVKNNVIVQHARLMQTMQHTYTVGLRNQRCKIWHDPPATLRPEQQLSSMFHASLSGAKGTIMLDTGAAANCISESFCKNMHLRYKSLDDKGDHTLPEIVTADGRACPVKGTIAVHVALQSYKAKLHFLEVPLSADCDAILGEPWHSAVKATMIYGTNGLDSVRLYKGRTIRKIKRDPPTPMDIDQQEQKPVKPAIINQMQFKRASKTNFCFTVRVMSASEKRGGGGGGGGRLLNHLAFLILTNPSQSRKDWKHC